jgi:CheY-like chemotaxis protein
LPPCDVLVVHDDPDLMSTLTETLRGEGYLVASAADGGEALEYLRTGPRPRAIVVDLMLPGLPGARLIEQLGSLQRACGAAVVVFTAASEAYIAASGLEPSQIIRNPMLPALLRRLSLEVPRPLDGVS